MRRAAKSEGRSAYGKRSRTRRCYCDRRTPRSCACVLSRPALRVQVFRLWYSAQVRRRRHAVDVRRSRQASCRYVVLAQSGRGTVDRLPALRECWSPVESRGELGGEHHPFDHLPYGLVRRWSRSLRRSLLRSLGILLEGGDKMNRKGLIKGSQKYGSIRNGLDRDPSSPPLHDPKKTCPACGHLYKYHHNEKFECSECGCESELE